MLGYGLFLMIFSAFVLSGFNSRDFLYASIASSNFQASPSLVISCILFASWECKAIEMVIRRMEINCLIFLIFPFTKT